MTVETVRSDSMKVEFMRNEVCSVYLIIFLVPDPHCNSHEVNGALFIYDCDPLYSLI